MGGTSRLFFILAIFFWIAAAIYFAWSIIDPVHLVNLQPSQTNWWNNIEWVGTLAITLSGILSALISFYIGRVHKGQGGELPEDRQDALIDDGEAEQGFFSPWSWWPVMLGGSAAIVMLGLAVGIWLCFIGGAVLVVSLVGWQYEYYRGLFSH
jgi:hypothetical protein